MPNSSPLLEVSQADRAFEERLRASEEDLRGELSAVKELRLLSDEEVKKIREAQRAAQKSELDASRRARREARSLSAARSMLIGHEFNLRLHQALRRAAIGAGLALESGPDCRLDSSTAADLEKLSKVLRSRGLVTNPAVSAISRSSSESSDGAGQRKLLALQSWCDHQPLEEMSGAVPALAQMLQVEEEATRLLLVRELTRIESAEATTSLAVRAIADLSPAVRQAAVAPLQGRPWEQYGPVLLRGLRYPWPPVADHAAVALRTLKPQEAVAPLVGMLDLPSPSGPYLDNTTHQYAVRELVRINHLRSCLLCHAPSAGKEDGLVRGLVPTPGEPLPVRSGYYEAAKGDFVRADITYLHQDFSVNLPTEDVAPWPREQRYDFMTRMRQTLTPQEAARLSSAGGGYPQREAVLYALRGLTGKDGGDSSARWRELLGLGPTGPVGKPSCPAPDNLPVFTTTMDRPR